MYKTGCFVGMVREGQKESEQAMSKQEARRLKTKEERRNKEGRYHLV